MRITGRTKVLCIIGHPVEHSVSPAMHNSAIHKLGLDYMYVPFNVLPDDLPRAVESIRSLGIVGANITVPYKEAVISLLDEVSEEASMIGSVNTVTNSGGKLSGSTTDGAGFVKSLIESGFSPAGSRAILLGAGGAGRAVAFALAAAHAEVTILNRASGKAEVLAEDVKRSLPGASVRGESGYDTLKECLKSANLLVNSTTVGMSPNPEETLVSSELIRPGLVVYDLVYNPLRTRLLSDAEAAGAVSVSGLGMLVHQGAMSFETWIGVAPSVSTMLAGAKAALGL